MLFLDGLCVYAGPGVLAVDADILVACVSKCAMSIGLIPHF